MTASLPTRLLAQVAAGRVPATQPAAAVWLRRRGASGETAESLAASLLASGQLAAAAPTPATVALDGAVWALVPGAGLSWRQIRRCLAANVTAAELDAALGRLVARSVLVFVGARYVRGRGQP